MGKKTKLYIADPAETFNVFSLSFLDELNL